MIFALKKARASGRNVGKVFQPCFEAGIRELPFLNIYLFTLRGEVCIQRASKLTNVDLGC